MLKSILLAAGGALLFSPLVLAQPTPQQETAPPPAAAQTPEAAPAAPAGGVAPDTTNPVKPTPAGMAKAKELYSIDCAMCHGDNGNGKTDLAKTMEITPADFAAPSTLANLPDGAVFNVIRAGKGKMPGEDPRRANDAEVWNLVTYVRSFSKPAANTAAPAANTAAK